MLTFGAYIDSGSRLAITESSRRASIVSTQSMAMSLATLSGSPTVSTPAWHGIGLRRSSRGSFLPHPKLEPALILSDPHRPYHDKRAWDLVIKVGQFFKPQHLIVNGDLADFYSVSSHSKDPSRVNQLDSEIEDVNCGLDELDSLGALDKRFIAGNHEDRLTRYLQDRAPELFKMISIPELFKLKKRGWSYTPYKDDTKLGKLHATHDVGTAGRYAAYKALDTYQHSVVTGHTHRMSYVVEGNAVGEFKLSAQFGWLGDINKVDYMHKMVAMKNWALGFGVGYVHPTTGVAYLVPVPIIPVKDRYTCMVNGRYFEI
jgi:predicted phosphodiesterase